MSEGTPPSRSINSQSPVDHGRKQKEPLEMQQRWGADDDDDDDGGHCRKFGEKLFADCKKTDRKQCQ